MMRQPRYQDSGGSKLLFFTEIFLLAACFYAGARFNLDVDPYVYFLSPGGLARLIFACASILLAMYFYHLYADVRVRSRVLLLEQLCEVFGISLVVQSLMVYAKPDWTLPRWLMIYGVLASLLAIFIWRVFYSTFILNIVRRQSIVFVCPDRTIREIARDIKSAPGWGYQVLGFIDDHEDPGDSDDDGEIGRYLGCYKDIASIVRKLRPDRIVVGQAEEGVRIPADRLLDLRFDGMVIEQASRTFESLNQRVSLRDLDSRDLIFSRNLTPTPYSIGLQRFVDCCGAVVLTVLAFPLMAVLAAGFRLTSKGPFIVRSPRAGYHGKTFQLLRFPKPASSTSVYARLHLNALPELINVLRGEMSLVGPKPEPLHVVDERSRKFPFYEYRLNVLPGITGWAQLNLSPAEQGADPGKALECDLYYIRNKSHTFNMYILITTLKNRLIWRDAAP